MSAPVDAKNLALLERMLAHVDAALGPPILVALLATHRRAGALAGLAHGFAVGVKLWPILLAPLLARALGSG